MREPTGRGTERTALLATKLSLPGPQPGQVQRPRLMARLDEGLARGLVLVCAPAGYGKTVLLADWARRGGEAARARARPGTGERVATLLGPPAPSSFQGLVTALINDLAADEAMLVLDD